MTYNWRPVALRLAQNYFSSQHWFISWLLLAPASVHFAITAPSARSYLMSGVLILAASIGGLWFSLPTEARISPIAQHGRDTLIAIVVTIGSGLGLGAIVFSIASLIN